MGLSKKQLQQFASQLKELKLTLTQAGETGEQAEKVVELDQTRVGRLSRMDAMQVQAMSKETGRRRRQHIIEIDAALKRIDKGEYGDCLECGEPINPKRLAANPRATLCIHCAEALE